jgi:hypothetical protein
VHGSRCEVPILHPYPETPGGRAGIVVRFPRSV